MTIRVKSVTTVVQEVMIYSSLLGFFSPQFFVYLTPAIQWDRQAMLEQVYFFLGNAGGFSQFPLCHQAGKTEPPDLSTNR